MWIGLLLCIVSTKSGAFKFCLKKQVDSNQNFIVTFIKTDIFSYLYPLQCTSLPHLISVVRQFRSHLPSVVHQFRSHLPPHFVECQNLLYQSIEPDPSSRILLSQIENHPWTTKSGSFPFSSYVASTKDLKLLRQQVSAVLKRTLKCC